MEDDCLDDDDRLERAIRRLKSLHEGYAGVTDVIAFGRAAVPALKAVLVRTETSGIFELRCRAISALTALGAHDVLIEFLSERKEISDPIARGGEDAVISAVARALIGVPDERIMPLLGKLAERRSLAGVIEALGAANCPRALPTLVRALHEDTCRPVAEAGLLRTGATALPLLVQAASTPRPNLAHERVSSLRARRSAARLLQRIGISEEERITVAKLVWDADAEVAAHACQAILRLGHRSEREIVLARLTVLAPRLRSPVRQTVCTFITEWGSTSSLSGGSIGSR